MTDPITCPECGAVFTVDAPVRLTEATATAVKAGSWVSWAGSGGTMRGKVASVHSRGTVPAVGRRLVGTQTEPAARVKVYAKDGGTWKPTGQYAGVHVAGLSEIDPLATATEAINGQLSAVDLRELLCDALEDDLESAQQRNVYVSVVDFTGEAVVYCQDWDDDLYQRSYSVDGVNVTLGEPTSVVRQVTYVPVEEPAEPAGESTREATEADAKAPYGDVAYADPGYQKDGKKRYPVDTADHVRAAWSYINQADNAAKYSSENLAKVKGRIKAAAKKLGVEISDSSKESTEDGAEQHDRIVGRVIEAKGNDEAGGRVFRVQVIAYGDSRNNRRYPESVMRAAVPLYEGAKAYDHHRDDSELRSSTISGLVGYYRDVEAVQAGIHADLHLLPGAQHAAEALDASLAAQQQGMAPLVGISHDVMATYRPLVDGGRRLQEATAITKVNSADIVADPAAGGKAVRMVAGGTESEPADDTTPPPTPTKEGTVTAPTTAADTAAAQPQPGQPFNAANYITVEQALALLRSSSPAQLAEATGLAGSLEGRPNSGTAGPVIARKDSFYGRLMIEQKVTDAGLPSPTFEAIYKALPDRVTEADVDAHIVAIKASLGVLERANLAPSAGVKVTKEAFDKKVERLDKFFEGDFKNGYHSIKQAYADFTGVRPGEDLFMVDWNRKILQESFGTGYDSSLRTTESMDSTSWNLVLGDSVTRRMVAEYDQPDLQNWRQVVSSIVPVNDFRTQRIDRIGGYGTLPAVNQGAPYQPLTSPPNEEVTYAITKRGGTEDVTLEMIANDDVRAIQRIPKKLGLAAAQTLYRFVWDILNPGGANPLLYDGVALYAAGHANTASTALAGSALSTIRQKMRAQAAYGDSSDLLSLIPRTLIVVNTLEELAWELVTSAVALPSGAPVGAATNIPNLHQGTQLIVVDYWTSTTGWLVVADSNRCPTMELGFYQGQETPSMFSQSDPNYGTVFNADKMTYKIRHIYSGAVLDYRAFQRGNS